jgi:uncharacterized RDD family membrane protein YckC
MDEIYVAKSGIESGPFSREQIPPMLESGMLTLTDSVWHQDLPAWIPVHQFLGMRPSPPRLAAAEPRVVELPSRSGEPAQFGRRLGASSIDAIVWFVLASVLSGLGFTLLFGTDYNERMTDNEVSRIVVLPALLIAWIYSAAMESGPWRATVGKLAFGLVVSDLDGQPVSFWRASRRFSWKVFGAITMGLTLLPSVWTRRRQNVHDLLSQTLVLRK